MTTSQHSQTPVEPGHGHSVAAWTGVCIILFGALACSLAVVWASTIGFVIGAAIILVGVIAWKVLKSMGYGEKPHGAH